MSGIDQAIGQNLKQQRLQKRISAAVLASALQLTEADYLNCEAGMRRLRASELFDAAAFLNVPLSTFMPEPSAK